VRRRSTRSVVGSLRTVTLIIVRGDRDEAPVRRYGHHGRSAGPASPALRTAGLAGGSCLAVAATVVVLLTDDPQLLRLAVVGAAWAFVLAALARSRPAADVSSPAQGQPAAAERADLERAAAELRREVAELAALRRDLAGLAELRTALAGLDPTALAERPIAQRERPPVPGAAVPTAGAPAPADEDPGRRLAELPTESGLTPPSGGRRRRRHQEDGEGDDVLARVLGR
jgi:hypothetical protein